MPRIADDVLIGGGRVFLNGHDIGWLSGEIKVEEQGNSTTVKESEGSTVVTINSDKEVHFTFNLLEANLDTLRMLNPSYTQVSYGEENKSVENEYIPDLGASNGLKNSPVSESIAIKVIPATTMTNGNSTGDTEITVDNIRKFEVGDTLEIVQGSHKENATVSAVDSTTGTVTLENDLLNAFPAGAMVKITTANKKYQLGTDYNFYP